VGVRHSWEPAASIWSVGKKLLPFPHLQTKKILAVQFTQQPPEGRSGPCTGSGSGGWGLQDFNTVFLLLWSLAWEVVVTPFMTHRAGIWHMVSLGLIPLCWSLSTRRSCASRSFKRGSWLQQGDSHSPNLSSKGWNRVVGGGTRGSWLSKKRVFGRPPTLPEIQIFRIRGYSTTGLANQIITWLQEWDTGKVIFVRESEPHQCGAGRTVSDAGIISPSQHS
jgi:hypothetical protein